MRLMLLPALLLGAAVPLLAQETPAPAAPEKAPAEAKPEAPVPSKPGSPRMAVIDMARVSGESLLGKSFAARLEGLKNEIDAEKTKKQNELSKQDELIKALQDDLEKQGGLLSPEGLDKKKQEIVRKQRDRQAFLEDGQAELERMQARARQQAEGFNADFQQRIRPHIEAVAREKGVDILLDSGGAMTFNKAFDVSQDVIVRSDEADRKAKAAAKPVEKPAARPVPAAPKPSPSPRP
jgi:Skp family chaperone for outer membrane proteins